MCEAEEGIKNSMVFFAGYQSSLYAFCPFPDSGVSLASPRCHLE